MATEARFEETGSVTATANKDTQLLSFKLDDQEYALGIANVVQVVRMVAITPVPKAPQVVEGVINLRGKVIPVVNLRKRCSLPPKPYGVNNHLLIAKTNQRVMALIVDVVSEMLNVPVDSLDSSLEIGEDNIEYLSAVGRLSDRLLLVLNPSAILTLEEERRLDKVLVEAEA